MKNNTTTTELSVKCYYSEKDIDIKKILADYLLLFIEREVKKVC